MKVKNLKLFGIALSGILSLTTLSGCGSQPRYTEEKGCEFTRQFGVGEHIISVPLNDDISECNMQIETHPGYEVVGVSFAAYGQYSPYYAGGVIVYSNVEEVECSSNIYDENGEYVYLDFGYPLNYKEEDTLSEEKTHEFDVGEHVISVPIMDDITASNSTYEYHEGYEVVGITVAAYGRYSAYYGGGAIIYKNIVPVEAVRDENGYTTFGEVIEKGQKLTIN